MQRKRILFKIISLAKFSQLQSLSLWNVVKECFFLSCLVRTLSALLLRSLKTLGSKRNELNTKEVSKKLTRAEGIFRKRSEASFNAPTDGRLAGF
jgi:hypothetical protein